MPCPKCRSSSNLAPAPAPEVLLGRHTFRVLVVVSNVLFAILAYTLGADILAHDGGVDTLLSRHVALEHQISDVRIDLRKDKWHIILQLQVSFLDCFDWSWTTAEDSWGCSKTLSASNNTTAKALQLPQLRKAHSSLKRPPRATTHERSSVQDGPMAKAASCSIISKGRASK